jgi:hypothetical protein
VICRRNQLEVGEVIDASPRAHLRGRDVESLRLEVSLVILLLNLDQGRFAISVLLIRDAGGSCD